MNNHELLIRLQPFLGKKTTFKEIAKKLDIPSEGLIDMITELENEGKLKYLPLGKGFIRIGEINEKTLMEDPKLNSKPWIPSSSSIEALAKSRNYLKAQEEGEISKLIKEYSKRELYINSYTNKKGTKKISINLNEELARKLSENNEDVIKALVEGIKKEI